VSQSETCSRSALHEFYFLLPNVFNEPFTASLPIAPVKMNVPHRSLSNSASVFEATRRRPHRCWRHFRSVRSARVPTLEVSGRTGGVGAARHWRESKRPPETPVVAIRAFDTALTKAGDVRGIQGKWHNVLARRRRMRPLERLPIALTLP
jgi:hypothetical protein